MTFPSKHQTFYITLKPFVVAVLLLSFVACKHVKKRNAGPAMSTELLDTIKSTPPQVTTQPALFESAFVKGTTQKVKDATFNLYGITIGKIKVVSGHITACDPLHIEEYGIPFTQLFPTGDFPVQLSIARYGDEEMIAFGRINFSDEPVVRWELALQPKQEPHGVFDEDIEGLSVDAGIVMMYDSAANPILDADKLTNMDTYLYKELGKHNHDLWKYTVYNQEGQSFAAFTTGMGDGHYASYIGFNAAGKPCRLVTDFALFNWKKK